MNRCFASVAVGLFALAAPTLARVPDNETFIDEDADQVKEVEALLNEVLLVDETGRVVMREEVRGMLPPEAMGRAEAMLGALVKVDEGGKLVFKDPEMVRPYLPMIRGFLDQGGLERLRELQKLPPEERREALRKMMEEQQGGGGGGMPNPFQRPPAPAPAPKPQAAPPPPPPPAPKATPERDRPHAGTPDRGGTLEERLARIERALERIEGQLEKQGNGGGESARPRRRGLLDRLFGDRGEGRTERMQFGRRTRVMLRGLAKLRELMLPEDMDRLRRAFENLSKNVTPEDMRDQERLMQKAQESLDPEDMARFMEIFSDFLGTDEGREFVAEVESSVQRLEELMNSERGDDLQKALEGLGGEGGKLGERLRDLIQGRDKDQQKAPGERHQGGRSEPRPHSEPAPQGPRPGSRPY